MNIVVPYAMLVDVAEDGWPTAAPGPVLRLFTNNLTPDGNTAIGAFTQCTDGSYAPIPLSAWPSAVLAGALATFTFSDETFSFAGIQDIYGAYITDVANSVLYWSARRDAAPIPFITFAGATLLVHPTVSLSEPIP